MIDYEKSETPTSSEVWDIKIPDITKKLDLRNCIVGDKCQLNQMTWSEPMETAGFVFMLENHNITKLEFNQCNLRKNYYSGLHQVLYESQDVNELTFNDTLLNDSGLEDIIFWVHRKVNSELKLPWKLTLTNYESHQDYLYEDYQEFKQKIIALSGEQADNIYFKSPSETDYETATIAPKIAGHDVLDDLNKALHSLIAIQQPLISSELDAKTQNILKSFRNETKTLVSVCDNVDTNIRLEFEFDYILKNVLRSIRSVEISLRAATHELSSENAQQALINIANTLEAMLQICLNLLPFNRVFTPPNGFFYKPDKLLPEINRQISDIQEVIAELQQNTEASSLPPTI